MRKLRQLYEWVFENLTMANQKQSHYYNLRRRPQKYGVGDLVMKCQHVLSSAAQGVAAKLTPKFAGPFRMARALSSAVYELVTPEGVGAGKVHACDLKAYHSPSPVLVAPKE